MLARFKRICTAVGVHIHLTISAIQKLGIYLRVYGVVVVVVVIVVLVTVIFVQ